MANQTLKRMQDDGVSPFEEVHGLKEGRCGIDVLKYVFY
jgi:hypothetical protein